MSRSGLKHDIHGDFPRTLRQFERRFHSEPACRRYLLALRWPNGYRCPACGGPRYALTTRDRVQCRDCRHQGSLTAGTFLHGTNKPLHLWFRTIWWLCAQRTGLSARDLQRILGLGSYQTAWTWLHRIRGLLGRIDHRPLRARVAVTHAVLGRAEFDMAEARSFKMAKLAIAVEEALDDDPQTARMRLAHVPDFQAKTLAAFVRQKVETGTVVATDASAAYQGLTALGYAHQVCTGVDRASWESRTLTSGRRLVTLVRRWLMGTHQGGVQRKHLQAYLNEFSFRYNRRWARDVGFLFYRVVQLIANTPRHALPGPGRSAEDTG